MKLRKRKGFALMTVLFVVIILSIFFISIITITQSNTRQVRLQEDNLRAYYLKKVRSQAVRQDKGVSYSGWDSH